MGHAQSAGPHFRGSTVVQPARSLLVDSSSPHSRASHCQCRLLTYLLLCIITCVFTAVGSRQVPLTFMLTPPIHEETTTVRAPGLAGLHAMPQPADRQDTKPGLTTLLRPQQEMAQHVQQRMVLKKVRPAWQLPVPMSTALESRHGYGVVDL